MEEKFFLHARYLRRCLFVTLCMLHVLCTVTRSFNEFQAMSFVYKNYFLVAIEDYTLRTANQKDWIAPFEVFEQTPFVESVRTILRIPARIIFINFSFSRVHVIRTALNAFDLRTSNFKFLLLCGNSLVGGRFIETDPRRTTWTAHPVEWNKRKPKIRFSKVSCSSA